MPKLTTHICAPSISLLLAVYLTLTLKPAADAIDSCIFPDFLQSIDGKGKERKHWLSHVTNNDAGVDYKATGSCGNRVHFNGGKWQLSSASDGQRRGCTTSGAIGSYRRDCVTPVQRNRFVVRHYDVIEKRPRIEDDEEDDGAWHQQTAADEIYDVISFKGYICVEFIPRSPTVVQLRVSTAVRWLQGASTCGDDAILLLDEWPLIDFGTSFFDFTSPGYCRLPFFGGYSVRVYDKSRRIGLCDAFDGETRVEFSCASTTVEDDEVSSRSDGLVVFRFRHASCVPDGFGMSTVQPTYCVASWTDSDDTTSKSYSGGTPKQSGFRYSYAVLRHDVDRRAWCLRFPTPTSGLSPGYDRNHHRSFTAILFRDFRCDRQSPASLSTENYLSIDFLPEEPIYSVHLSHPIHQQPTTNDNDGVIDGRLLCRDDYEACSYWRQLPCNQQTAAPETMACPRRCGICSDSRPASSEIPQRIIGRWKPTRDSAAGTGLNSDRYRDLVIDNNQLKFVGANRTDIYHCVFWDVSSSSTNNSTPSRLQFQTSSTATTTSSATLELMFVRLFADGCRPRYICVQFHRPSQYILLIRTSVFQIWPFVETAESRVTCSTHFHYPSGYRLYVSDLLATSPQPTQRRPTYCDSRFISEEFIGSGQLQVDFDGGIRCHGKFKSGNDGMKPEVDGTARERVMTGPIETFTLLMIDCPTVGHESEQTYRCIDTVDRRSNRRLQFSSQVQSEPNEVNSLPILSGRGVLTETGDDGEVLCWWFPTTAKISSGELLASLQQQTDRFYLLPGVACYDNPVDWQSVYASSTQQRKILATLTRQRSVLLMTDDNDDLLEFYDETTSSEHEDDAELSNHNYPKTYHVSENVACGNSRCNLLIRSLCVLGWSLLSLSISNPARLYP